MLSKELELILNKAFQDAHEHRYEEITVEHLLYALIHNQNVIKALESRECNINELKGELSSYIIEHIPLIPPNDEREPLPTLGFQRVLQRAVFQVQASDKKEVDSFDLFVALFSEQDSHAVHLLNKHDIQRFDMVDYIKRGVQKKVNVDEIEKPISKVFISHSSEDSNIVEEVIEILEVVGLDSNQIFCTSFEGYSIGFGENFLNTIKCELSSDSLVIFILSKNFYESPVCLCEMGAAWALVKEHIPILIPPLEYSDIKGVIPLSQGFKINEPLKLNLFKEKIESDFSISNKLTMSIWERKRDRIIARIEKEIT
jgi:hypothetical protein